MKRFVYITVALVAIYLLLQNAEPYTNAVSSFTEWFSRFWQALTQGKVKNDVAGR